MPNHEAVLKKHKVFVVPNIVDVYFQHSSIFFFNKFLKYPKYDIQKNI